MPPLIDRVFGRVFTAPPMPPEAFPPGVLGKTPAVQQAMQQAWRTMFLTTLTQGMILGVLLAVLADRRRRRPAQPEDRHHRGHHQCDQVSGRSSRPSSGSSSWPARAGRSSSPRSRRPTSWPVLRGFPSGPVHDRIEVMADLPESLRIRNTVGTDGAGLCVWASTGMMANYLNVRELFGIFEELQREPGRRLAGAGRPEDEGPRARHQVPPVCRDRPRVHPARDRLRSSRLCDLRLRRAVRDEDDRPHDPGRRDDRRVDDGPRQQRPRPHLVDGHRRVCAAGSHGRTAKGGRGTRWRLPRRRCHTTENHVRRAKSAGRLDPMEGPMLGSKLILLLALIGQTPGAVSPTSPAVAPSRPRAATAITATRPGSGSRPSTRSDGKTYQISGWLDADGTPRFDPREYPQFVAAHRADPEPSPRAGQPRSQAGLAVPPARRRSSRRSPSRSPARPGTGATRSR